MKYAYVNQLPRVILYVSQVRLNQMRFRMHIDLEVQAYVEAAQMLLPIVVYRWYIFMYQGLADGGRLRLHLLGLAPRLVGVRQWLREDHEHALL